MLASSPFIRIDFLRALCTALCLAVAAALPAQDLFLPEDFEEDPLAGLESPLRVTGTLRGVTGPAEGVLVYLELTDMRIRRPIASFHARTDTSGFFEFDVSNYEMPRYGLEIQTTSRRHADFLRIEIVPRDEMPYHFDVRLQPGALLRGVVMDEEGEPLEDVFVGGSRLRTQRSERDGEWEIFGMTPGHWRVRFWKDGYSDGFLEVEIIEPGIMEGFEVVLESARVLEGTVRDWRGNPIPRATVVLQAPDRYQRQTTNSEGRYRFRAVPESLEGIELRAVAEGILSVERSITSQEADLNEADLVLAHGVYLTGLVRLPDGTPAVSSAVTALTDDPRTRPRALSDSDGRWRLGPFSPGQQLRLVPLPPNPEASWGVADATFVSAGQDGRYTGDIPLWPKGFESTLTATFDGERFAMERDDRGEGGLPGTARYSGAWNPERNRIEGELEVLGMQQEGTFSLRPRARRGGLAGEWELREEIGPSMLRIAPSISEVRLPHLTGTVERDLAFVNASPLHGEALRANGAPFIDGTVFLTEWEGTDVYDLTAEIGIGGRFTFDRVPPGSFVLMAISRDRDHVTPPTAAHDGLEHIVLHAGDPEPDPIDD